MRKILFIFALLGAGIVQGNSQEVLSLEECLNIGILISASKLDSRVTNEYLENFPFLYDSFVA